jgi:hypothetical protein
MFGLGVPVCVHAKNEKKALLKKIINLRWWV